MNDIAFRKNLAERTIGLEEEVKAIKASSSSAQPYVICKQAKEIRIFPEPGTAPSLEEREDDVLYFCKMEEQEELNDGALILTIKTTAANKLVDLTYQISERINNRESTKRFTPHAEILWGDGATTSLTKQGQEVSHIYETAGEYSITINGSIFWNGIPETDENNPNSRSIADVLTEVSVSSEESPVKDIGERCFADCTKLTKVHEKFFNSLINKKEICLKSCFDSCTGLTSIQENLLESLDGYENIDLSYFFYKSGLASIPENIFASFASAVEISFERCFYSTAVKTIPTNLFSSLYNVEKADFSYFFPRIANSFKIPETLFAALTKCKEINLTEAFYSLDTATGFSIPAGLFSSFTSVEKAIFSNTFCGRWMTTIPETLFAALTNAIDVDFTRCFWQCTKLTAIPANLFASLTNAKKVVFDYLFAGTMSTTPAWSSIPAALFSSLTNVEDASFSYIFAYNTKITSAPATLFHALTKATKVSLACCFLNCTAFTTPPTTLLPPDNLIEWLSVNSAFNGTKVTNPSASIFANLTNCKTFYAFSAFDSSNGTSFTLNANLFSSLTNVEDVWLERFIFFSGSATQTAITIPENLFAPFQNAKTVRIASMFYNRKISSIPNGLLKPFSNATKLDISSLFSTDNSVSNTLPFPAALFEPLKDIEELDVSFVFQGRTCSGSIPDNFLSYFENVKRLRILNFLPINLTVTGNFLTGLQKIEELSIGGIFNYVALSSIDKDFLNPLANYKGLKKLGLQNFYQSYGQIYGTVGGAKNTFTSVPEGILDFVSELENLESIDLTNFFYANSSLVEVPKNLLAPIKGIKEVNLSDFCHNTNIKELPALDFDTRTKSLNLYYAFCGSGLQSIPSTYFDNVPTSIETIFKYCFYNCSNVTGSLPPLWTFGYKEPESDTRWNYWTFHGCSKATNYQEAVNNGWA